MSDEVVIASQPDRGWLGRRLGGWSRLFAPGYGRCRRCKTPWKFVREHPTTYWSEHDPTAGRGQAFGTFCLCEFCWAELTPGERLPYYRHAYLDQADRGGYWPVGNEAIGVVDIWPLVELAVLSGG